MEAFPIQPLELLVSTANWLLHQPWPVKQTSGLLGRAHHETTAEANTTQNRQHCLWEKPFILLEAWLSFRKKKIIEHKVLILSDLESYFLAAHEVSMIPSSAPSQEIPCGDYLQGRKILTTHKLHIWCPMKGVWGGKLSNQGFSPTPACEVQFLLLTRSAI